MASRKSKEVAVVPLPWMGLGLRSSTMANWDDGTPRLAAEEIDLEREKGARGTQLKYRSLTSVQY